MKITIAKFIIGVVLGLVLGSEIVSKASTEGSDHGQMLDAVRNVSRELQGIRDEIRNCRR